MNKIDELLRLPLHKLVDESLDTLKDIHTFIGNIFNHSNDNDLLKSCSNKNFSEWSSSDIGTIAFISLNSKNPEIKQAASDLFEQYKIWVKEHPTQPAPFTFSDQIGNELSSIFSQIPHFNSDPSVLMNTLVSDFATLIKSSFSTSTSSSYQTTSTPSSDQTTSTPSSDQTTSSSSSDQTTSTPSSDHITSTPSSDQTTSTSSSDQTTSTPSSDQTTSTSPSDQTTSTSPSDQTTSTFIDQNRSDQDNNTSTNINNIVNNIFSMIQQSLNQTTTENDNNVNHKMEMIFKDIFSLVKSSKN